MKFLTTFTFLAALALAGCSSNITNLRQQINPTPQSINVDADQRAAFDASVTALTQMGFTITARGAAQGRIEAIGPIAQGAFPQSPSRQITASVRFDIAPDNGTAIQILFIEIQNDRTSGGQGLASRQPLASSPLYDVFKQHVTAALPPKK